MQENLRCPNAKHLGLKRFKKLANLRANTEQSDVRISVVRRVHYRFPRIEAAANQVSTGFVPTVLIADDSASMRRSVRFLLERRHPELTVQEAVNGVDAIEAAKQTRPDLILLDLAMPELNGAEAASVLKNSLPETPIILSRCTPTCTQQILSARSLVSISFRKWTVSRCYLNGSMRCCRQIRPNANPSLACRATRVPSDIAR